MRVLHVAAGNLYGGVERILEEIARHGGGHHAFALSFRGRLSSALEASGAEVHALGEVRFSRPWSVWAARRRLQRLVGRARPATLPPYHAVIGHSPWAYALAAPVVRRSGARRVLWAHDALGGRHWTERRVASHLPDLVICNSRYSAQVMTSWLDGVRKEVVYAPVSPASPDTSVRHDVRRQLGASDSTTVMLLASRLQRSKGHAELLRAAASLGGDWTIWMVGGAQRPQEVAYEQELRALAASLSLRDRIVFLGERTDVGRLLQAADVHCQPNTAPEAFGLVFVEALYAAVPVVTSDVGGAREIVTADCGVLVPLGDLATLTRTLQALVDDPARRGALGAAGPPRARLLCDPLTQMLALERALIERRCG